MTETYGYHDKARLGYDELNYIYIYKLYKNVTLHIIYVLVVILDFVSYDMTVMIRNNN